MQTRKIRNPTAIINQLKARKKAFFIYQTLYTKKIFTETENFSYTQKTDLKKTDLAFIKQVKDNAKKLENIPFLEAKDIHYIDRNETLKEDRFFKGGYEIDLNSAFWNFAFQEKFISEPLYEKGLLMPKKTRLIALGALAKKITVMKYTGDEFLPIEFIKSVKTQGVFFRVAQLTSYLMQELKFISGDDYLFFWCDAIFLKNETAFKLCVDYLEGMNYAFKSYKIDAIKFGDGKLSVASKDYAEKHPNKNFSQWNRVFTFEPPRKKNNTYKFFNSPLKPKHERKKETPEATEEETPF